MGVCPQKTPSYATGYYKTFASLYCQHVRVRKSNIPGVTQKGYGKVANFLEHTETSKLCGTLVMKTMNKNAKAHNINKVTQELTVAGLHIDNEESFKKNNK